MSSFKEKMQIHFRLNQQVNRITHSYIFLFSKEAHADVVPERGALRDGACCHSILVHGHIKVPMGLHHAAGSQDGLGIKTMIREVSEEDVPFETAHDERRTVPPDREWPFLFTALKKPNPLCTGSFIAKVYTVCKCNVCLKTHIPCNCWGQKWGHFQGAQKLFGISQAGKNKNTENYISVLDVSDSKCHS